MRAKGRWTGVVVSLVLIVTMSGLVAYGSGGWNYSHSSVSPDGKYRVDLYTANRWQWMTHILSYEEPGFARLARTSDNRMMGTSGVITLMDSNVTWLPDVVVVGTQTRHELPDGRWE